MHNAYAKDCCVGETEVQSRTVLWFVQRVLPTIACVAAIEADVMGVMFTGLARSSVNTPTVFHVLVHVGLRGNAHLVQRLQRGCRKCHSARYSLYPVINATYLRSF